MVESSRSYVGPGLSGAKFSPCRRYRYSLWRRWDFDSMMGSDCHESRMIAFVGLNPSKADEITNDRTVNRCIGFAKRWGWSGMFMLNCFAYRETDPVLMMRQESPEGAENLDAIRDICRRAGRVVCCWGNDGQFRNRAETVLPAVREATGGVVWCLGKTKIGEPRHPLYLAGATELERF